MSSILDCRFEKAKPILSLGPCEKMLINESILNNWTTLGMLQFLSCLIVGQFGEIVFAKISFDESTIISDERYCCLPWDSIFEVEWSENITCRCSIEIRHSHYVGMVAPCIASL